MIGIILGLTALGGVTALALGGDDDDAPRPRPRPGPLPPVIDDEPPEPDDSLPGISTTLSPPAREAAESVALNRPEYAPMEPPWNEWAGPDIEQPLGNWLAHVALDQVYPNLDHSDLDVAQLVILNDLEDYVNERLTHYGVNPAQQRVIEL